MAGELVVQLGERGRFPPVQGGAFLFGCGEEVGSGLRDQGVWFTCRVDGSDDSAGGKS